MGGGGGKRIAAGHTAGAPHSTSRGAAQQTDRLKHGEQQAPHRSGKSTWYGSARSGDAYRGKSSSYEGGTGGLSGSDLRAGVAPRVEPGAREPGCADGGSRAPSPGP